MKKLLCVLFVLLSIIVSGCGSEESDAIKVLNEATEKNLKLAQMKDKTAAEYARELGSTIYHTTCKVYKFDNKFAEEQEKIINEIEKVKLKATMNMLDSGGKSIFNLPKAKEDALKEVKEANQKLVNYKEKHKDYIAATNRYKKSISAVIDMNNNTLSEKNDVIDGWLRTTVSRLAEKNNYKDNIDFSNLDTYKYGWTKKSEKNIQKEKEAKLIGKVIDGRILLYANSYAFPEKEKPIRSLKDGEIIKCIEDYYPNPWVKIKVLDTGEEGYILRQYNDNCIKYGVSQEQDINKQVQEPNNNIPNNPKEQAENTGIINGDEVNVRKGPGVKYESLGVFFKGDKVRLVGEQGNDIGENWYQIEYDNPTVGLIKGWVRKDFININQVANDTSSNTRNQSTNNNDQSKDVFIEHWNSENLDIYVVDESLNGEISKTGKLFTVMVKQVQNGKLIKTHKWSFTENNGEWRYSTEEMDKKGRSSIVSESKIFEYCMKRLGWNYVKNGRYYQ